MERKEPPRLLKPKELSELIGVSEHTLAVWRCTKRQKLPYVKFGKLVVYPLDGVIKFINDNEHDRDAD